jgi:hypothetical protein
MLLCATYGETVLPRLGIPASCISLADGKQQNISQNHFNDLLKRFTASI